MDTTTINLAIDAAYDEAIANGGQRTAPQIIAQNATVQTDVYISPNGGGFRVVGIFVENNKKFIKTKNYGPDVFSEHDWKEMLELGT